MAPSAGRMPCYARICRIDTLEKDVDNDEDVDLCDFSIFAVKWLEEHCNNLND